jgi:hypothetical protein
VLAKHFPGGATCEDLRRQFEKDTSLARQSFYNALSYAKKQHWIVGGGRDRRDQYQLYSLNADGSWKEPVTSIGEGLEKDWLEYLADSRAVQIQELQSELERLRDWTGSDASGEANVALSSLVRIVGNSTASTRQRLRAAAAVLGYKVHDNGVTEFVKRFLGSVCASTDIAVDYKIAAGELLRRHEAARIIPPTERPPCREDEGSEAQRIEAWRRYLIDERKWKLARETHNVPHWSQWAADLYADDFVPPQSGWPPQAVVGPDAIKLCIERSQMRRANKRT